VSGQAEVLTQISYMEAGREFLFPKFLPVLFLR
jgi:hypothetical protein